MKTIIALLVSASVGIAAQTLCGGPWKDLKIVDPAKTRFMQNLDGTCTLQVKNSNGKWFAPGGDEGYFRGSEIGLKEDLCVIAIATRLGVAAIIPICPKDDGSCAPPTEQSDLASNQQKVEEKEPERQAPKTTFNISFKTTAPEEESPISSSTVTDSELRPHAAATAPGIDVPSNTMVLPQDTFNDVCVNGICPGDDVHSQQPPDQDPGHVHDANCTHNRD